MEKFLNLFLIFFIYSVIGYYVELIFCSLNSKKLVLNRGFLIGPYLPIYGFGGILISLTLGRYVDDILTLFILSTVYCTVIEYITSYILEKIFHLRWWDYSNKKYNINGRVCLSNGVLFGLGGLLIIKVFYPFFYRTIYISNSLFLMILSSVFLCIFLTDLIVSIRILFGLKSNIIKITNKDATSEIKKEVFDYLINHRIFTGRLFKSFPDLEDLNEVGIKDIKNIFDNVKKEIENLKKSKSK